MPPDVSDALARLAQVEGRISIVDVAVATLGDLDRLQVYARELLALGNRLVPELRRSDDWPGNPRALVVRISGGQRRLEETGVTVRGRHTNRGSLLTFLRMPPDASLASPASLCADEKNPFDDGVQFEPDPDDLVEEPFGEEVAAPALPAEPALPGENPFEGYEGLLPPGWEKES